MGQNTFEKAMKNRTTKSGSERPIPNEKNSRIQCPNKIFTSESKGKISIEKARKTKNSHPFDKKSDICSARNKKKHYFCLPNLNGMQ